MVRSRPLGGPERDCYQRDQWPSKVDGRLDKLEEDFHLDNNRCQSNLRVRLPSTSPLPAGVSIQANNTQEVPAALSDFEGEWAVLRIQNNGLIDTFTSPGLKEYQHRLFTQSVVEEVQHATQRLPRNDGSFLPPPNLLDSGGRYIEAPDTDGKLIVARRQSESTESSETSRGSRRSAVRGSAKTEDVDSDNDQSLDGKRRKRRRWQQYSTFPRDGNPLPTTVIHTQPLVIGETARVVNYYNQRFKDMQQTACKIIAKAFVKIMEPKKQTNYPYSGNRAKAPYWWPTQTGQGMVRHREPDHLLKHERIMLLVHIIEVVVDQKSEKSDSVKAVTVKRLEEVTYEAMAAWWSEKNKPNNIKKRPFLKEIFKVAKQEERYRKGELDADAVIPILHGDPLDLPDDEPEEGLNYNEEEIAALALTPNASQVSSPDSMVSPHTLQFHSEQHLRPVEGDPSENYGYNSMRGLSSRPYVQQNHMAPAEEYPEHNQMPLAGQVHYLSRPSLQFQPQTTMLHDPSRRPSWHANGYPSPTPSSNFGNWISTPVLSNGSMQFANFSGPAPPPAQSAPYNLPLPTGQPILPPPLLPQQHMPYNDALMARPYDGPPGGPLRQPHHIHQHQQSFQEYLCESGYAPPSDNEMKEAQLRHQN